MSTEKPTRTSPSMGHFPPPWLFAWGKWTREVVFLTAVSIAAAFILNLVHPYKVPLSNNWTLTAAESKLTRGKALRVDEMTALLKHGAPTVFDLRSSDLFAQSHIPGAVSLPLNLSAEERLPKLTEACRLAVTEGGAIVYCCGVNVGDTTELVKAMRTQDGIKVSLLTGGFEEWEAKQAPVERI